MSSLKVAFIIGSGGNVGHSVAIKLKSEGYRVAVGSRHPDVDTIKKKGLYPVTVDASVPQSILDAFATIDRDIGAPNVVVFNAAVFHGPPSPNDPLSIPQETYDGHLGMVSGLYAAAQQALQGFRTKEKTVPKAFIFTGNIIPWLPSVAGKYLVLGTQKVMGAYLMHLFSDSYNNEGIGFHYAHLVGDDGNAPPPAVFRASGPVHAAAYWDLISKPSLSEKWDYRFTKDGKEYHA